MTEQLGHFRALIIFSDSFGYDNQLKHLLGQLVIYWDTQVRTPGNRVIVGVKFFVIVYYLNKEKNGMLWGETFQM